MDSAVVVPVRSEWCFAVESLVVHNICSLRTESLTTSSDRLGKLLDGVVVDIGLMANLTVWFVSS